MLKTLWVIDALLLFLTIALATFSRSIDAAGRGILRAVPLVIAVGLGASFLANRAGAVPVALGRALIGPAIAAGVMVTAGRSSIAARQTGSGAAYWDDPRQRELSRAIASADSSAMQSAISAGADPNLAGKDGTTPLEFAIAQKPEMVGVLVHLGANPNPNTDGRLTPLAQALVQTGPAFDLLLDGGADPNGPGDNDAPIIFSAISGAWSTRYEKLVATGADVHRVGARGRTTLMTAAESSQWKMALDLLQRGVDTKAIAPDGVTIHTLVERAAQTHSNDRDFQAFAAKLGNP
ncbi:MAG: ankyrin repeat domain-containing protein [Gemmatimonas sp.]